MPCCKSQKIFILQYNSVQECGEQDSNGRNSDKKLECNQDVRRHHK
eukprot:CAMPEP_0185033622 /NCGR_PEP_ID=MMETSP1103-20130426/22729_1 /TAXON_ID=36769 /ORGANISM="Paraphysomonas bandaiensis, Strain Caron Lab Isolate" /LENGTH=45 /DNA_ID= /DNA_START= /DNA_END= /DNA_ORIENTATION=